MMSDDFSLHPALAAQRITPLQKQVVQLMSKARRPVSQSELLTRILSLVRDNKRSISQATLSRAMTELIELGLLHKSGVAKGAKFTLAEGVDHFLRAPHLRPPVRFEISRIADYQPNETIWLAGSAHARMHDAVRDAQKRHVQGAAASRRAAERFLIDLSWASASLEGATYEYLDTMALINYGQKAPGRDPLEATLILNHKRAIAFMMDTIGERQPLSVEFIFKLHSLLMRDILLPAELGRIRELPVEILASSYKPTNDVRLIQASLQSIVEKSNRIEDPCENCLFLLNSMSYLQAFLDGNKRTARLLANYPLLFSGFPPLSFVDVDKHAYLAGLIAFYEVGDLRLINDTVASAYEMHAPSYEAAIIAPNITRTVELRERRRIDNCIAILANHIATLGWSDDAIAQTVLTNFDDLNLEDQDIIIQSIKDTLGVIDPLNSCAWEIDPEIAAKIVSVRDLHQARVKSPSMTM